VRIVYLCADRGIPVGGHKGASAHVRGLVRAFAGLGHDVVLLASDAGTGSLDPLVSVVRIPEPGLLEGVREHRAPRVYRALGHLWNNGNVERSLEQVVADHAPDLLYERYSPFGIAGGVVARRHGLPHVLEVNAPLAWEGAQYRRQALADAAEGLEYAAFANAQHLLVVSAELCDLLVEAGHDRHRIHVVPNGVDDSLFTPAARRPCTDTVTIGFVGSLKPWHGLENLRDAFVQLAPDPRYRLLVVGDGPANGVLSELARAYPDRVLLTGAARHEDIPSLLGRMDIAVAPYPPIENFYFSPLKVLEYMAAGLPVVASDIGQLRQLVRPGETGLLVPPGDASALSAAIQALAADPSLMTRMGETGSAEVLRDHTWVQRAQSILSLAAAGPAGAAAPLQATA
jgi:glycosyltransferase involved in cell wall biosynthesis